MDVGIGCLAPCTLAVCATGDVGYLHHLINICEVKLSVRSNTVAPLRHCQAEDITLRTGVATAQTSCQFLPRVLHKATSLRQDPGPQGGMVYDTDTHLA